MGLYYCGKEGHLMWSCHQSSKLPQFHVQSAKDHTGEETDLRGVGPRGSNSHDNQDWRCLGVPTKAPILITPEEPQVLITMAGQSVDFLLDNFLSTHWSPWSTFFPIHYCNGTVRMSQTLLFQSSFKLQLGLCCFLMSFWSCHSLPQPFWGGIYWTKSRPLFSWIWNPLF